MKYLALSIGGTPILAPSGVPQGGLSAGGTGVSIINVGIQLLFIVAAFLALAYLIYGGVKWMTSGGDQEKLAAARVTIMYAIGGLALTALSFLIINVLGYVLTGKSLLDLSGIQQ